MDAMGDPESIKFFNRFKVLRSNWRKQANFALSKVYKRLILRNFTNANTDFIVFNKMASNWSSIKVSTPL